MGIWIKKPRLDEAETVLWQKAANHTVSDRRAGGGRLYLTAARVLFQPHRIDAATGVDPWSAPLASIRLVTSQARDGNRYNGGLRTRLRLDLVDGSVELFVVNGLEQVIRVIQGAVAQSQ